MDDQHYIKETLRGNTKAYEVLVNRYKDMVYAIAFQFSFSKEDSKELAQNIFVKVFENLGSFKSSAKFSTWLYRIAYNTAISEYNKQKRKSYFTELDEHTHPEDLALHALDNMIVNEQKALLECEVKKLPPEEQALIHFFYHENLPVAEISSIANISESNVKTKLFRIRQKLATAMKSVLYEKTN